jgi:hypothetical protein
MLNNRYDEYYVREFGNIIRGPSFQKDFPPQKIEPFFPYLNKEIFGEIICNAFDAAYPKLAEEYECYRNSRDLLFDILTSKYKAKTLGEMERSILSEEFQKEFPSDHKMIIGIFPKLKDDIFPDVIYNALLLTYPNLAEKYGKEPLILKG